MLDSQIQPGGFVAAIGGTIAICLLKRPLLLSPTANLIDTANQDL